MEPEADDTSNDPQGAQDGAQGGANTQRAQQSTPPAGDAQNAQDGEQGVFDADYVAKLRREAAKYRTEAKQNAEAAKRLREIEDQGKSEAQRAADEAARLRAENADLQARILRADVASAHGIPAEFAGLLVGETREDMEAAAEALGRFRDTGGRRPPAPPASAGQQQHKTPGNGDEVASLKGQIADAVKAGDFVASIALREQLSTLLRRTTN